MNRHLKFLELDYLDVVTPEEIRKKGILTECANFYLRITPKGIDHISEMRRYIKPKYLRALKILEIIP
jgi:hypothetical protein